MSKESSPPRPSPAMPSAVSRTTLRIGCKINLSLRIVGVRPNGWHELDTLFLPLDEPHDTLELAWRPEAQAGKMGKKDSYRPGLSVRCSVRGIDRRRNTLTSAYSHYAAATRFRPALVATLRKGIPHGAGLGGGSADAAALLLWLNEHCPRPLRAPELLTVAAKVGADVAFFLHNRPCRGTGVGEILEPSDCLDSMGLRGTELLLLCPRVRVSTPRAYAAWDAWCKKRTPSGQEQATLCLTEKSVPGIYRPSQGFPERVQNTERQRLALSEEPPVFWLENSFEAPVFEVYPRLRRLKEQLLQAGAFAAVMSGSGSALFGLFRHVDTCSLAEDFREKDMAVYRHVV